MHSPQRFAEVVEVDALMARGMKRLAALKRAGVSRSVYDDWKPRLNLALRAAEE
jgi:transposase